MMRHPAGSSDGNHFAWLVIAILFLASVVSYMDRATLGVVMPQLRHDIGITNADYGLSVNAFLAFYALFYILGGRIADRLGCRRSFLVLVVFSSIAKMAQVTVTGLRSLCALRAVVGVGEGGFYPTAMRGASEWFSHGDRAKAVGILLCGISVGALATPPAVAWLTMRYSWRAAFLLTGSLGLILVPVWLVVHRRIAKAYGVLDPAPASKAEKDTGLLGEQDLTIAQVLKRRKYWCLLGARALSDTVWYFYLFWLPAYFQEARGFSLAMVGTFLWIPFAAADVGALSGAWISSVLIQRGMGLNWGRKSVLIGSALCGIIGASAAFVPSAFVSLALVSLALFGHLSWSSTIQTAITEVTPPKHVGFLYGMTGAAGTLVASFSQPVVGRIIDSSGYDLAFAGAAMAYTVALMFLFVAGRIERIR